jgi:hypothetical protein
MTLSQSGVSGLLDAFRPAILSQTPVLNRTLPVNG